MDPAVAEEEIDDTFEKTIKASATATGHPEVTTADDESIFDEPTLRQIREPLSEVPTDTIESGATLPGRKPQSVTSEPADEPPKKDSRRDLARPGCHRSIRLSGVHCFRAG